MKFGIILEDNIVPEWRFYYLEYNVLKKALKERTTNSLFSEKDEASFVESLEHEIQKVFDFRDVKLGELIRHVQSLEERASSNIIIQDEDDHILMEEIERITQEINKLSRFCRLNYTGFYKILKKHDKQTNFMLKPMFSLRLKARSPIPEGLDDLIVRLSSLYDKIRKYLHGPPCPPPSKETGLDFHRKTTKYWIHEDNVTEVKCYILKYLPIFQYSSVKDISISSVYFDNEKMDLYQGRLDKRDGAIALRLRWYGDGSSADSEIWIERKIHKEDWTGESSVKSRFPLKEKYITSFLSGSLGVETVIDLLRKQTTVSDNTVVSRFDEKSIEEMGDLALEVKDLLTKLDLRPIIRTFYRRTAFQFPNDSRVRISLDSQLTMIKENPLMNLKKEWRRMDFLPNSSAFPFPSLVEGRDIIHFPHSILEVKLQTTVDQENPNWAMNLTESELVEEVPKFSKFIHGSYVLWKERLKDIPLPYWIPQMDVDIRKGKGKLLLNSLNNFGSSFSLNGIGGSEEGEHTSILIDDIINNTDVGGGGGGDDDNISGLNLDAGMGGAFFGLFKSKQSCNNGTKRIAIPVRIEPKVYFANERTFLSWVHFSIFLGGIAAALVGLGHQTARLSGYVFAGVSILFLLYALYLFRWRAEKIRNKDPGPYDDRVGPVMLTIVFIAAMLANLTISYWVSHRVLVMFFLY